MKRKYVEQKMQQSKESAEGKGLEQGFLSGRIGVQITLFLALTILLQVTGALSDSKGAQIFVAGQLHQTFVLPAVRQDIGRVSVQRDSHFSKQVSMGESSQVVQIKEKNLVEETIGLDDELTDSFFEYEQGLKDISVAGRLKSHFKFWKDIDANKTVLDIIYKGYVIPLYSTPPRVCLKNNASALKNPDFVEEAIKELLKAGAIMEVFDAPDVVNPLSVAQNSKKKRLVLDLRHVNPYVWKQKHKFEDLRCAIEFAKKNGFMITFDLKSGYHHIEINQNCWKYLGFSWTFGGKRKFFVFKVLPFGLSSAGFVFTKVLRELVKSWRSKSYAIVLYLDDGVAFAKSYEAAKKMAESIKQDLINSGFVPNVKKSEWNPSQMKTWLGFEIDLKEMKVYASQKKLNSIAANVQEIICNRNKTSKRELAQCAGRIVALHPAFGEVVNLMTKAMHIQIMNTVGWDRKTMMSETVLKELRFWQQSLHHMNGKAILIDSKVDRVVYSDASNVAFGGYTVECGVHNAHGNWNEVESKKSSTWRELKAVQMVFESLIGFLEGSRIKWMTDNQNVVNIIKKGSMKEELQDIAVKVFQLTLQRAVRLEIEWIPRTENEKADFLSKLIDVDDWGVTTEFFRKIDILFGPHTVDRFATHYNTKLDRFNSRMWNPGSEAIDAFTQNWTNENNWLVPPISLVPRVVQFLIATGAKSTLVVPKWKSAIFWPVICNMCGNYNPIFKRAIEYNIQGVLRHYKNNKSLLGSENLAGVILVLRT